MADMFALTNTGLSDFLLSRVGEELNGSELTILSMLARIGKDPWVVAAAWAIGPRATAIGELADAIARTPLREPAARNARQSAFRLVQLLPPRAGRIDHARGAAAKAPRWPFLLSAALGLALSVACSYFVQAGFSNGASPVAQAAHRLK